MSRVATNYPPVRYPNGHGQLNGSFLSRSSSNASSINGGDGIQLTTTSNLRPVTVRSAAPPPAQKETVHACPLCNGEYKDPRVLPCTHTFCLTCIREKLIDNSILTCPKCQHQVPQFDNEQLKELPRNLILSQEWRMNARLPPTTPTIKKPVTYQPPALPNNLMANQEDKRRSVTSEALSIHESPVDGPIHQGVAALVNNFNKTSIVGSEGPRSSRASSITSNQAIVSDLVRKYSEKNGSNSQLQQQSSRSSSVISLVKKDDLDRNADQASIRSQRDPVSSLARTIPHTHELAYEEIAWDTPGNGTIPVAPFLSEQLRAKTIQDETRLETTQRPHSAAALAGHRRELIGAIREQLDEQLSPDTHALIQDGQLSSRPSTASRSYRGSDDGGEADDEDRPGQRTPVPQIIYAEVPSRNRARQDSNTDSLRSAASGSHSRHSPMPPVPFSTSQEVGETVLRPTISASSSLRRSQDRFPSPPVSKSQKVDTLENLDSAASKRRSVSSIATNSSTYSKIRDTTVNREINPPLTHRFDSVPIRPPSNSNSHRASGASTPTNRPPSISADRSHSRQDQSYLVPRQPTQISPAASSRVDLLLSDQKNLERDIEERMKRLKHDYDDIRAQINRKESAIHKEVESIAERLDQDITEHYHRKQKIFATLAADANHVRSELELIRSNTPVTETNTQQLMADLQQIESNIRSIRRAVDQENDLNTSLTFAEGRRALGIDTIGQISYNQIDSPRRPDSSPSPPKSSPSHRQEQLSMNISPYKYIKIDHLSTLEPETIAITDNNKKILLGICNKLFILDEYGETLKAIQLSPSIRGIAISKRSHLQNIAYVSHDETVSIIDIDNGQTLDSVKETDSSGESGTFLPLGIDTDSTRGDVYVCDYRNSCVIKFDEKLEFITQWRVYNHCEQYDEARPKLISVYGQRLYMIVEHSCKPYYNQGIAYTFSLHICDTNSGNIIKIIDAELLATQRLRWPCSVQAIDHDKCYILDTMTSGKYFNGQWQKHWSRVLEISQEDANVVTELFQLDSEASTMAMTKENMIIAANGDFLFVDLGFLRSNKTNENLNQRKTPERKYQNLP